MIDIKCVACSQRERESVRVRQTDRQTEREGERKREKYIIEGK